MTFQLPFHGNRVSSWNSAMVGVFIPRQVRTPGISHLQPVVKHLQAHHGLGTLAAADLMAGGCLVSKAVCLFYAGKGELRSRLVSMHGANWQGREPSRLGKQVTRGQDTKVAFGWFSQDLTDNWLLIIPWKPVRPGDFKTHIWKAFQWD